MKLSKKAEWAYGPTGLGEEEAMTINEQVATRVMGWEWKPPYEISFGGTNPEWPCRGAWQAGLIYVEVFDPAHSMADAWMVVEKMRDDDLRIQIWSGPPRWVCKIWTGANHDFGSASADTAPLAICLAALKAVEEGK